MDDSRPLKRKRLTMDSMTESQSSSINDARVGMSWRLKLDGKMIEVVVGSEEDKESFHVHEALICDRSEFFRNAMKPEWASTRPAPRVIELPDDDMAAFDLYVQWLYSKKLPIIPDEKGSSPYDEYQTLAHAYVLGEELMDIDFKNAVMDSYVLYARGSSQTKRYYPTNEDIRILYEGTRESSPIRQFLVDIWTYRGKHEWVKSDPDLPKDFLMDVTTALLKVRTALETQSRPWKNSHEQYYEH
ncbi:hypothetical protein K469DRAFT_677454 [Zopfia rhizophila CBS 207.26]|uniref:BTB domain-containing protein n=1 Tax=Zopfia rhizophila CBS 207.26 TaxID=1314779 RepID=A0A6A6DEI7_9PEZI|nr:hypothetical protein K469DRAFT_677454 [Zopfia rhizophila CBS 207.26]